MSSAERAALDVLDASYVGEQMLNPQPMENTPEKDLTEKQNKNLGYCGQMFRGIVRRAYEGIASPRQAIKAKCIQCVCFDDVVNQIRDCNSTGCPLWQYRPYQDNSAENQID